MSLVRHEIGDSDIEWDTEDHDPDGDHDGTEPGMSSISDCTIRCKKIHEIPFSNLKHFSHFYNFFRSIIAEEMLGGTSQTIRIGGPGKHVEVDESHIGKRLTNTH